VDQNGAIIRPSQLGLKGSKSGKLGLKAIRPAFLPFLPLLPFLLPLGTPSKEVHFVIVS
jgi:hypothetical protein